MYVLTRLCVFVWTGVRMSPRHLSPLSPLTCATCDQCVSDKAFIYRDSTGDNLKLLNVIIITGERVARLCYWLDNETCDFRLVFHVIVKIGMFERFILSCCKAI